MYLSLCDDFFVFLLYVMAYWFLSVCLFGLVFVLWMFMFYLYILFNLLTHQRYSVDNREN